MSSSTIEHDYERTEYSRDLQISTEGHENIQILKDIPGSPFADADMKEVYVMAAAYGYRNDHIAPEDATGSREFVQRKALSDEQVSVMEAIAIAHEGTPMVLKDEQLVGSLVQRYALGGIEALIDHCKTADKPRDELLSEVKAAR